MLAFLIHIFSKPFILIRCQHCHSAYLQVFGRKPDNPEETQGALSVTVVFLIRIMEDSELLLGAQGITVHQFSAEHYAQTQTHGQFISTNPTYGMFLGGNHRALKKTNVYMVRSYTEIP